jgi:hypothetical protein
MKKHNPGCNCCGKVLIYDVGRPNVIVQLEDCTPIAYNTLFLNAKLIKQYLEEIDPSVEIHHVLVGEDLDTLTSSYYGTSDSNAKNHNFDPETEGVDLKYWSGNIEDYSLIYWAGPIADFDATADPGVDCLAHGPECPNNAYIKGGFPKWWDIIKSVTNDGTNKWRGRLIITGSDNGDCSGGDWVSNIFLNNYVFPSINGLQLSSSYKITAGDITVSKFNNGEYAGATNTSDPLMQYKDENGFDQIIPNVMRLFSNKIDGGIPLVTNETAGWADCCDIFGTPIPQYTTVAHQIINGIDFILSGNYVSVTSATGPPQALQDNTKRFIQNLWTVPV